MSDAFLHADTGSEFRIGSVLARTFSVFGRQFWKFMALGLVSLIPMLIYAFFVVPRLHVTPLGTSAVLLSNALSTAARFIVQTLVQSISVYGALQTMRGQPFDVGRSLMIGLRRLLPVFGVALLGGLAVGLGMILLLVPAFIAMCMFYVAVPVCVAEQRGILPSLGRSAELTKDYRWPIFGLLLLVVAAAFVVGIVSFAVPYALIASRQGISALTRILLLRQIVSFAWLAVSSSFSAVLATAVYHDLRTAKEGVGPSNLAAVFD